ncbi:hypothetical protein [Streptomyces sp. NPDC048659]|uniref:hypothetical protein n=1 Tax=Streptomyces sp. NPDC048659 TaxID=3155489 RepID=UPI0034431A21
MTITNRDPSIARVARFRLTTPGPSPLGNASCAAATGPLPGICATNTAGALLHVEHVHENRLPARTTATTVITTTVRPDAQPGTYTITPFGGFSDTGLDKSETFAPQTFTFTVQPRQADLAVSLSASAPLLGGGIDYTATATNHGPAPLNSATLTTRLPDQTTTVTGLPSTCTYQDSTKTVTCSTGSLTVTGSAQFAFRAQLGLLTVGQNLHATATRAASSPEDPGPANDTATTTCSALTSLLISC